MHVVLYCRISTDEDLQRYSLGNQEEALRRHCAVRGWEVAGTFSDRTSGSKAIRPGLNAMLDFLADDGKTDAVLVTEQDRLSRLEEIPWAILKQTFRDSGVKLFTLSGEVDFGNEDQEFTADILALIDRRRRKTVVRQMVRGRAAAARRGEWLGRVPYGYRHDPKSGHLEPVAEEAAVVREVFRLYAAGGAGSPRIAAMVGDAMAGARGWVDETFILRMIRNPAYAGDLVTRIGGEEITVVDAHPAIVDRDLWRAANALLERRGSGYKKAVLSAAFGLVAGMVRCAECREILSPTTVGRRTKEGGLVRYHYYRHVRGHRKGCRLAHRADAVDAAVRQAMARLATSPDAARRLIREAGDPRGATLAEGRVRDLEARIRSLEAQEERLLPLYLSGEWDRARLDAQKRLLGGSLREARAQLGEVRMKLGILRADAADLDLVADAFAAAKSMGEMAFADQRRLVLGLVSEVLVHADGRVSFTARIPMPQAARTSFAHQRVQVI